MPSPISSCSDLGTGVNIGPDDNAPQFTIQNFYGVNDNFTWTKGRHTLKFGAEYREYISPQNFTQRARGDYEYNTTQLFMEDFSPDIIGQRSTGNTTYYGNQNAIYWYANDTWRMTSHLTLSLGVRYEYTTIPIGEQRQSLNAISNSPNVIIPQVNEPLIFDKPRAPKNDYAPRIGIAYSPGNSGTTSIRAGFGMAYDTLYDNIGILSQPPQIGSTNNVNEAVPPTPNFLANGGLAGGGSGITVLDRVDAMARHRGLDSAGRQVSVFAQLEPGRSAFVREELHRRSQLRRHPWQSPGRAEHPEFPVGDF